MVYHPFPLPLHLPRPCHVLSELVCLQVAASSVRDDVFNPISFMELTQFKCQLHELFFTPENPPCPQVGRGNSICTPTVPCAHFHHALL